MRASIVLRSAEFRREREATWRRLEGLLLKAERVGTRRLGGEELLLLPTLHRATVSSLSVARAISLDKNLVEYLEGLGQRAHFVVYGVRRPFRETVREFFAWRFPALVRALRWHLALAVFALAMGTAVGWALTAADPERFYAFVSEGLAGGRGPHASTERLREGLYDGDDHSAGDLGFFSSFLFTHNARVAMLVAALGFVAGVPTFLLLFMTGLMVGAFGEVFGARGLGPDFWGWVLPHGITELLAVCLAGAAGFALAQGMVFPGRLTRRDALAARGRQAGAVLVGVVLMLLLAGLLEGVFRQVVTSMTARYLVAAATAALWIGYFGGVGRGRSP